MRFFSHKPHPLLQDYFEEYFAISVRTKEPIPSLVIPDGTHGILFVEKASIHRFSLTEKVPSNNLKTSYVFGQKTAPVYYDMGEENLFFYGIKIKPTGLKPFVKPDCKELTNKVVEAKAVFEKNFSDLESMLFEVSDLAQKFQLFDAYFLKLLRNTPANNKRIINPIIDYIHLSRGHVKISELTKKFNIGIRTLDRLFNKEVGLSPKAYCRVVRFNASIYNFQSLTEENLTQLAYTSGYYDQNHFIKEVKNFTNLTPQKFYRPIKGGIINQQKRLFQGRFV